MSFAGIVKEELFRQISSSRHCQIAELSALFSFSGASFDDDETIVFETENELVARKCFTLLVKTFNINKNVSRDDDLLFKRGNIYGFIIDNKEDIRMIKQALSSDLILQKSCCMRAYLRGSFLVSGSVSDPSKSYHYEIVCRSSELASTVKNLLDNFDIEAKEILRKKNEVIYLKEGALIVEALNVMEAHVALMEFENSRIIKEMRNSLNRRVNCEAANITKTVNASVKQTDDIRIVMQMPEYKVLPDGVKQIAELRLQYPDASLKELGQMCDPQIGKSGVNHRLRKLALLAENKGI